MHAPHRALAEHRDAAGSGAPAARRAPPVVAAEVVEFTRPGNPRRFHETTVGNESDTPRGRPREERERPAVA